MRVLEQHQHRLLLRQALHLVEQRRKRLAALLRGREVERRIAGSGRDRQHRGDQRRDLVHAVGRKAEHFLELFELRLGRLLRRDARRALELLHEGIERAVAMIGRALVAQPHVRRLRDLLGEPGRKPRLADARLARDQHDLALAAPGAALARDEIGALGLAPDEAGEPGGMRRLEAALARRHAERRESLDRLGEALDRVPAQLLQPEPVADQAPGRRRDNDAARLGEALQPRGEIGRVADDRLLLRRPLPDDVADDDEAGRDPDAHREFFARARLQPGDDLGDLQPRMDRARGVVLVRAGKAEIGEDAVTHEFRDEAVVARHHARAGVLIGADDLAHVLRVEPRRERSRADEVCEHDGELAALGRVGRAAGRDGSGSGWRRRRGASSERCRRPSAGACGALTTRRSFRGRRPSGRSEPRRRCRSREIALRTARDRGPAARPRHPSTFPQTGIVDDGLTRAQCP